MTETLRIALVTETFPPEVNGVARTLRQLCRGLVSQGHDLQLVRPKQPGDPHADAGWSQLLSPGVPIPLYPGLRFGLPVFRRLRRSWLEDRPDVIHIATEGPLGLHALRLAFKLEVPVLSTFHTNFHQYGAHYGYGVRLAISYLRWFHNKTRGTLVPAPDVAQVLTDDGFERVGVLGRGVDGDLFHPAKRSQELRASWGAGPETPVAIYVGRLAEEKNLGLCARAFAAFRKARPGAITVAVGDGPAADGMKRDDPATHFAGMRRGDDLAAHYASADVMISPSTTETFGNVVLEAMSAGLPVLTYDYAAGAQLVSAENGVLVPFDDSERFLTEAERLATRPVAELNALGVKARATAEEQSWGAIVNRFVGYLTAVRDGEPLPPDLTARRRSRLRSRHFRNRR
ncbi:MAG: glycosyltransferase family 1 protein [Acidobacteriota bacterium]